MQDKPDLTHGFRQQVRLSWLALFCEDVVSSLWQAALVLIFILSLFLLDILPSLGFWIHASCLIAAGVLLVYFVAKGLTGFKFPNKGAALARLEQSNNLPHQPLRSLDDDLSAGAGIHETRALWQLHQNKLLKLTKSVRAHAPKPILAKADPYAIRLLAAILFVISLIIAGGDAKSRIWDALFPDISGPVDYNKIKISAWITPPVYTNMAPIFLPSNENQSLASEASLVEAPTGSLLVVQISNVTHTPLLQDGKGDAISFEKDGKDSFSYQQELISEDRLSVMVKGSQLVAWKFFVRPDMPPQISLTGAPLETGRKALHAAYKAYDDYGLDTITMRLRRPPVLGEKLNAEAYTYPVVIPGNNREYIEGDFLKDLTPHPWAGTQVLIDLIATDALENETISAAKLVILPQRVFNHPIALEIIKLRTKLALGSVSNRHKVSISLVDIGDRPTTYGYDVAVHLGLRAAALRLINPSSGDDVDGVIKLLWDLALRLEDGGLSLAEARLRAAQNAVMEALARGASPQELSRLMDELEVAMADYMQELVENMQQQDALAPDQLESGQEISPQDLKAMLDRIRDLMQMGMKDAAQQMLSEMQQMLENLQMGMPQQASLQGMEALEMMQGLKDIMQGQRELLERSYREMKNRQDYSPSSEGLENIGGSSGEKSEDDMLSSDAMIQQKLRQELGDLMKRFEGLMKNQPPSFNKADRAMGRAAGALSKGNMPRAVQAEGQALDQLQSAARVMQEQIMERFAGEGALGQQLLGESGEGGRDPLGRKAGSDPRNSSAGPSKLPAESDFQRVRSIRDELRRRSGDRGRPRDEIDYIDRLLQPF